MYLFRVSQTYSWNVILSNQSKRFWWIIIISHYSWFSRFAKNVYKLDHTATYENIKFYQILLQIVRKNDFFLWSFKSINKRFVVLCRLYTRSNQPILRGFWHRLFGSRPLNFPHWILFYCQWITHLKITRFLPQELAPGH